MWPSRIIFGLLIIFLVLFYAFSLVVTFNFNSKWLSENIYQNLHALDYATTTSDLSLRSFRTPALPMRLASTWEIQNSLNMPINPLASTYNLIYPMMEKTQDINRLLSEKTTGPGKTNCVACEAQNVFKFTNVLQESQKQQYCPKRGEKESEWLSRTGYTKQTDDQNSKFNFNSEHAEFCRKTRLPSMALAHVAINTFTLFSSQNTVILLLYIATVNIVFSFSMAIYKAWGMHLQKEELTLHKKLQIGSYYSGLFLVMTFISLIPAIIDFARRGDGKLPDNRSLGSLVVGLWTVIFSFVYVYVIPRMNVRLSNSPSSTAENAIPQRTEKDPLIIKYFVSHQPMISLAYWNFMQAPLVVLAVITRSSYGIDVYMQFIVFGAIAIGVMDIIHARMNMIMGLTRRIKSENGNQKSSDDWLAMATYNDFFVNCFFFAMNLVISIPIFLKLVEANVPLFGYVAVGFVLYSHLIQNALVLLSRYTRRCCKMEKSDKKGAYEKTTNWAFEWSLIWQMLVSLIAFFLVLGMHLETV